MSYLLQQTRKNFCFPSTLLKFQNREGKLKLDLYYLKGNKQQLAFHYLHKERLPVNSYPSYLNSSLRYCIAWRSSVQIKFDSYLAFYCRRIASRTKHYRSLSKRKYITKPLPSFFYGNMKREDQWRAKSQNSSTSTRNSRGEWNSNRTLEREEKYNVPLNYSRDRSNQQVRNQAESIYKIPQLRFGSRVKDRSEAIMKSPLL